MKKSHIARRRGTSVAAAALSFALVAPFAQPIAAPNSAPAAFAAENDEFVNEDADALGDRDSAHNQNPSGEGWSRANPDGWRHVYWANGGNPGQTQPKQQGDGSYNVDAIASGQIEKLADLSSFAGPGRDVVSGRAMVTTPRPGGQLTATYDGFEPLSDQITVYFQWMDDDGAVSPVYSAKTSNAADSERLGDGRYAFAVPEWIDAKGKKHRFRAQFGQRYQVWADPANDPQTGNELIPMRQAPGMAPGAFGRGSGEALGEFPAQAGTNGNIQRTGVWMYERPYAQDDSANNYMKVDGPAYEIDDPNRPFNDPNNHKPQLIHDTLGPIDKPVTHRDPVYRRTISGDVWLENGNENQLFTGATNNSNNPLRGQDGYKVFATALTADGAQAYDQFIEPIQYFERADRTKKWLADHPEYVAGTVYGEPDNEGKYTLRFPDDVFGSNAYTGAAMDQFQKHLYMWVEDKDGTVVPGYSTWTQPVFQDPRYNLQWSPTVDPSHNNAFRYSRFYNVNFATVSANDAKINITSHNNTDKPAKRGEIVNAELSGNMPVGAMVEWRDSRGNVLKSCGVIEDASNMQGCDTFTVPKDARDGDFYYAALTNGDTSSATSGARDIALDSFMVVVDQPQWDDIARTPTKDPVTLPNIGKNEAPVKPEYTVYEVGPKKNADGTDDLDDNGKPVLEDKRTLDESEYEITLDPDTQDLIFDPDFMPADGSRYRIEVRGMAPKIDPNTGETVYEVDENGDPVYLEDDNGNPVYEKDERGREVKGPDGQPVRARKPVLEPQLIDDATVHYRGLSSLYEPKYETYYYQFPDGPWPKKTFAPTFTDENGNPVSLRDMDKQLKSKGAAFTVKDEDLPEGWTNVQGNGKAFAPGDFSIDYGIAVSRDERGQIAFKPWDNNGEKGYEQVLRASGPVELPVTVTYADGSTDEVTATIIYVVDETDLYEVEYGTVNAVPGENTVLTPTLTRKDGTQLEEIEGATYSIPDSLPEDASDEDKAAWEEFQTALDQGYQVTVDPQTGVMTVQAPGSPHEDTVRKFDVPVTVTYNDGSSEPAAPAAVLLDEDGDGIADVDDVKVTPQEQTKDEKKPIDPIKVTPGNPDAEVEVGELPEGLSYNPETNEITGTPVVDWQDGETERTFPITVRVTNPDGTTADETASVTVVKDKAIRVHAIPTLTVPVGKEITPIPVRVTEALNKEQLIPNDQADIEVFWYDEEGNALDEAPQDFTFNDEDGQIEGTPKEADKTYKVVVRASRDGESDETSFIIRTVENTDPVPPALIDGPATDEVPADGTPTVLDDKVQNVTDGLTGEVRDKDGNPVEGAEVTIDTDGNITVTVPEGTDPQDATVVIKDADGNPVGDPIDIEITEPAPSIDNGEGKVEVLEPGAEQPTKLDDKVTNPTEDMTGEVLDNEGNPITGAEVTVDPETGEITVKVPEDAPTGPATVVIKDADGNQVDDPIHVVIAEPTADPTSVDGSNVTPVDPTDDEQPTGIKVENLDGDTRVQAKDEDGKVIPVIVDEDGNVSVVPGTDVDGPITVTVTDPELDGGQTEIKVPVTGHTEGADDNGSDRTVVPGTKVEEIEQGGSGKLDDKVTNPTDGMTGEVRDKDGNPIDGAKVTVDPETGEITVTLPEDAPTGPATVVVKDSDGNDVGGPIHIVITEKPAETPAPSITGGENPKDEVVADGEPKKIDDKVTNPTDGMTGEVLDKDGNPIDGAEVTVDPNTGEITVTVPEGTEPGDATVIIRDKDGNQVGDPIDIEITEPAPSIDNGNGKVEEIEQGGESKLDDKVTNPTDDMTGEVRDKDGNPIDGAKVTVDPETGEITVTVPEDAPTGPATVVIKDSDGNDVDGPIHIVVTEKPAEETEGPVVVPVVTTVDDSEVSPVDPTDDEQLTGIVVKNPSEDTKVTAVDEDGKEIPVRIDKNGNVRVTPGEDVDGPITVTITDDNLPNGAVDVEVPVNGHEKGVDDNGVSVEVDKGGIKTVEPNGEEQETGIKVKNPSEDTTVTAVDEDGNPVEVRIDDNGNVVVKPQPGVDGPIKVTITDPSLPNGSVEFEVPVAGHEKNRDDNGSDTPVDDNGTTVDASGKNTVQPTDEKQDSGIKVNNPSEDTTVTAVDEDGKDIPAKIDEDGNVVVTPGEDVDGPITVTVTDPNLPNGKVDVEVPVDGHSKNVDDNGSHAASVTTPDVPADGNLHVVGRVNNPDKDGGYTGKLVDRSGKEIEGGVVEIDPATGEIKVSVPAGTDPREAFVAVRDKDGKRVTDKDGYDLRVNIVAPNYGDATAVKPGEKGTSKDPFAGQDLTTEVTGAEVAGSDGADNWSFTIDGTSGVITGQAPTNEQLQDSFTEKFPNGKTTWDDFVKQFDGIANPSATGTITLDGVKDPLTGEAKFELVGKDGRSILDPNGDFDGDGVSNRDEIEGQSNPLDVNSTPSEGQDVSETPAPKPEKPGLTDDERKRCVATSVGFGLPLLALIPIGLATQTAIPGLTPVVEQYSEQIRLANVRIQQEMGVFNPEIALQVEVINKQLRQFGLDVATVGAGLALIAAGILTGTIIYDNCTPGGIGSSVQDLELKGSSGKSYASSSEKK